MGLDISLIDPTATYEVDELYSCNITHNLNTMAMKANLYNLLWRPYRLQDDYPDFKEEYDNEMEYEEAQTIIAGDIISEIEIGLEALKANSKYYKTFDSKNGWGIYVDFVPFIEKYLEALKEYPKAIVKICR